MSISQSTVFPIIGLNRRTSSTFTAEIGDFATITFTRNDGKMVDGNFQEKLTRLRDSTKINITEGIFKNVEIKPN